MRKRRTGKRVLLWLGSLVAIFGVLFILRPNLSLSEIENPELKVEKINHSAFIEREGADYTLNDRLEIDPKEKEEIYLSPIYYLENPTNSIGLKWQQSTLGPDAKVWLRVYEENWSDWVRVEKKDLTEIPDQAKKELTEEYDQGKITSELIFCDKATKFQYEIRLRVNRFRPIFEEISFYALGEEELPTWKEWLSSLLSPTPVESGVRIISRASWGAKENWTKNKKGNLRWPPQYARPYRVIIHHDGNARNLVPKSTTEAKTWIQGIYYWHAKGLGWGDIGYNYLVDPWGNIYQGRKGNNGVIAGHTYGQNIGSIGVCLLGNYQNNHLPRTAALDSLAELTGFKAASHVFSPYRLYGHKDFAGRPKGHNYTACPGKNLYKKRSYLRSKAGKYFAIYQGNVPDNTLISSTSSGQIFLIKRGKKRPFLCQAVLKQRGYQNQKVIGLSAEVVKDIPTGKLILHKNHTLLKDRGSGLIYRMVKGKKRPFLARKVFRQRGFQARKIKKIRHKIIEKVPLGQTIIFKKRTLLRARGKGTVWVIKKGERFSIASSKFFKKRHYRWKKIITIGQKKLKRIPYGGNIVKI